MHGMGLMITYCVLDSECRFFMSTSRVTLLTLSLHVVQVAAHFGASWCVTSLSMNYKFEELAQTHPDMLFLFVDVDDVPVTSHSFIPLIILASWLIIVYMLQNIPSFFHNKI